MAPASFGRNCRDAACCFHLTISSISAIVETFVNEQLGRQEIRVFPAAEHFIKGGRPAGIQAKVPL